MMKWKYFVVIYTFYVFIISLVASPAYAICEPRPDLTRVGKNYDVIRADQCRARLPGATIAHDYRAFKKRLDTNYGIQYSLNMSLLAQRGAPNGGTIPVQELAVFSLNWDMFKNQCGSGSTQLLYQWVNYASGHHNEVTLANRLNVATPVNDNPTTENVFSQLTYTYSLPKKWLSIAIGQFPIGNFDGNQYANNAQINFINYALSQDGTATYANAGLGAFIHIVPEKHVAFTVGVQNANNIRGANIQSNTFAHGPSTPFLRAHWTPKTACFGNGDYAILIYHQPYVTPQPKASSGWSFSAVQNLNSKWGLFLRLNAAPGTPLPLRYSYAGGVIHNNPISRNLLDQIGLGFAQNVINKGAFPGRRSIRSRESILEGYWAWTFDRILQITPDIQAYIRPALKPSQRLAMVYGLRATLLL